MAIGQRVGINLLAHNQPGKLVVLTPDYLDDLGKMHSIDVFSGGRIEPSTVLPSAPPCTVLTLARRMARNLMNIFQDGQDHTLRDATVEIFDLANQVL